MYAIIDDRGHQYKVEQGRWLDVQIMDLEDDQKQVEFNRVLLVGDREGGTLVGTPAIAGAKVIAKVVDELIPSDKIKIQKYKPKKNERRTTGHRQLYTRVEIESIEC